MDGPTSLPQFTDVQPADLNDDAQTIRSSRRSFLLLGASMALAGCAQKAATTASLPSPVWKPRTLPPEPAALPVIPPAPNGPPNVIARGRWATGDPVPTLMDRMAPVQWITVHHEGTNPFFATDEGSTAGRLESIRRAHRGKGWGDIGYHYAVDRLGRVWEGRPIRWQGAHVKDCNVGNIGVMCLGNFDKQTPTQQQLAALNRHVTWLMKHYRVQVPRLRTHQEWPSAATACPGVNLERYMVAVRNNRQIG